MPGGGDADDEGAYFERGEGESPHFVAPDSSPNRYSDHRHSPIARVDHDKFAPSGELTQFGPRDVFSNQHCRENFCEQAVAELLYPDQKDTCCWDDKTNLTIKQRLEKLGLEEIWKLAKRVSETQVDDARRISLVEHEVTFVGSILPQIWSLSYGDSPPCQ